MNRAEAVKYCRSYLARVCAPREFTIAFDIATAPERPVESATTSTAEKALREALSDMIDYAEDAYSDYCAKTGDYRKKSQEAMRREIDNARALIVCKAPKAKT